MGSALHQNFPPFLKKYFFFTILLFNIVSAKTQPIILQDSVSVVHSNNRPEQVLKEINLTNLHFEKVPDNRINFGVVGDEYYFLILKLSSNQLVNNQFLVIDNTSLDTVSIYKIDNQKNQSLYLGGNLVQYDLHKAYTWHTVPVEINSLPSYYFIALKSAQENINVQYKIESKEVLQKNYGDQDRIIFFYIGVVSLIVIIILLALMIFKRRVFVLYLAYILCAFTWILSHYGFIYPAFFPKIPMLNEIIKPLSSLGAGYFLLHVLQKIFKEQLLGRKILHRIIKITLFVLPFIICSMILLAIPNINTLLKIILIITWQIALIFTISIVITTPLSFIKTVITARIFSVAMLVICTMALVQLLSNAGYLNNYFIEEHGITIGSMIENIILAFGLFYNLLTQRKKSETRMLAMEQEQSETLKKLVSVQNNERKRIAADLHDHIGPLLAALKINFRRIIQLKEKSKVNELALKTEAIIDDSIAEIHNVALNLMPKGFTANGLVNTLNEYFESIRQLYEKQIDFRHEIIAVLNPDLQIHIYRILCELVLNAARHSCGVEIFIHIMADEKNVVLTIHDNGIGIQQKLNGHSNGLGLQNAESRVLFLQGKMNVNSVNGKGTHIDIEIPLQFHQSKMNSF